MICKAGVKLETHSIKLRGKKARGFHFWTAVLDKRTGVCLVFLPAARSVVCGAWSLNILPKEITSA